MCSWVIAARTSLRARGLVFDARDPHIEVLVKKEDDAVLRARARELHGRRLNPLSRLDEIVGGKGTAVVVSTGSVSGYGETHCTIAFFKHEHGKITPGVDFIRGLLAPGGEGEGEGGEGKPAAVAAAGGGGTGKQQKQQQQPPHSPGQLLLYLTPVGLLCNPATVWGGVHVTLVGRANASIRPEVLAAVSSSDNRHLREQHIWRMGHDPQVKIGGRDEDLEWCVSFSSRALNALSAALRQHNLANVKGPDTWHFMVSKALCPLRADVAAMFLGPTGPWWQLTVCTEATLADGVTKRYSWQAL